MAESKEELMTQEETTDKYTYISPYAMKMKLQRDNSLKGKSELIQTATNPETMDGVFLSTQILCDGTPFYLLQSIPPELPPDQSMSLELPPDQSIPLESIPPELPQSIKVPCSIIPVPCPPNIGPPLDGVDAMDSLLSGILILSCHGTVNFDYNLTTDYIIPYRMLFIYSTPFSFSGLSPSDITILSHRMNKLIHYRNNINNASLVEFDETCVGITTKTLLKAILGDVVFIEHNADNFRVTYDKAIEFAKSKGIPTSHLGKPHIGTPVNQLYCLSNYYFYNNHNVHDSFSGLFLAAFCLIKDSKEVWASSNYMPIYFKEPPTKSQGVMPSTPTEIYPLSTLPDEIKNMLVFDVSSIRDINKVKNMNKTLLNFIIKMLIARNVTFTSSLATILKSASGHHKSTPIRLDYSFIEPVFTFDTTAEANVNGLPVTNNNVKISRISAEDVSILLYVLWFISNGKWKEINIIMNYMNLMYFYYYNIMMKIPIVDYRPADQAEIDFISKINEDTSLLPLAAITTFNILINNYIHEQATINKITFATIHSVCRPNAIVEQTNTVQIRGQFSQDCEIALDCSPKPMKTNYNPQKVTSAFPKITVELNQIIEPKIQPIVEQFEPIVETVQSMELPVQPIQPPIIESSLITFYNFLNFINPFNSDLKSIQLLASAIIGPQNRRYFEDFPINQYSINNATIKETACNRIQLVSQSQGRLEKETTDNDDHLVFLKGRINNVLNYLKTGNLITSDPPPESYFKELDEQQKLLLLQKAREELRRQEAREHVLVTQRESQQSKKELKAITLTARPEELILARQKARKARKLKIQAARKSREAQKSSEISFGGKIITTHKTCKNKRKTKTCKNKRKTKTR